MLVSDIVDRFIELLGVEKLRNPESKKYISDITEIESNSEEANYVRTVIGLGCFTDFRKFDEFDDICKVIKDKTNWSDDVIDNLVLTFAKAFNIRYVPKTNPNAQIFQKNKHNNLNWPYPKAFRCEEEYESYITNVINRAYRQEADYMVLLACFNKMGLVFNYNEKDLICKAIQVYNRNISAEDSLSIKYKLANLYCSDYVQDYFKAYEIYNELSDMRHTDAMIKIGDMYLDGLGTQQNFEQAKMWYEFSADYNNSNAIFKLAKMYYNGEGIVKNLDKVIEYLSKSSELGNADAKCALANFCKDNKKYCNKYTVEDLYAESAKLGNPCAIYSMGKTIFEKENLSITQKDTAYSYLLKSSYLGNGDASYILARKYYNDVCKEYDDLKKIEQEIKDKIMKKYIRAGVQGQDEAMCDLAKFYYEGKIVKKSFENTYYWYEKAANCGNRIAMNKISMMVYSGVGIKKSLYNSEKWFEEALNTPKIREKNLLDTSGFDFLI